MQNDKIRILQGLEKRMKRAAMLSKCYEAQKDYIKAAWWSARAMDLSIQGLKMCIGAYKWH